MKQDLTERYIYAVTRRMPKKMQADVSAELRSLISDMLEERCGEVLPTEKDVRVVLTELGTPYELYQKYDGDGQRSLISAPYYGMYIYVLKIVLSCTAFGLGLGMLIHIVREARDGLQFVNVIGSIGNWVSGLVYTFAFVTILFAIFQRKGVKIDAFDGLDNLPEVPPDGGKISKGECVFSLIFGVLFPILFLAFPQAFAFWTSSDPDPVYMFQLEELHRHWYLVVAVGVACVVEGFVMLVEARYTRKVMFVNIGCGGLVALSFTLLLANPKMINPNFSERVLRAFEKPNSLVRAFCSNPQYIFLGFVLAIILLDIGTTVYKTVRYGR